VHVWTDLCNQVLHASACRLRAGLCVTSNLDVWACRCVWTIDTIKCVMVPLAGNGGKQGCTVHAKSVLAQLALTLGALFIE
jgi:hypothetical protein